MQSPNRPYSPGMRSMSSHKLNETNQDSVAPGEIQMQSFHDGAPPPPPVSHSWAKVDRWCERNYEELFDQLGEGCTQNDVNELEHELDCTLPLEVRESLMIHDGQERGGLPTGVIFGCMLLDCEEIVQEWKNWRVVNEEYLTGGYAPQAPPKAFGGASSSSSGQGPNPLWRQELLDRQDSQPPKAIQKAYALPSWIPLARDWGGNNIAVDLAPGPMGKWGQVIIFGRDYDCKYVIARSWAAFLAIVADDLASDKVYVDEETNELKLREFKKHEPGYLDILRIRTDQKYGRRPPPRKRMSNGIGVNNGAGPSGAGKNSGRDSPYSNSPNEERGRSPHRFPSRGPTSSPKTGLGVSSPLARVQEEKAPVVAGGDKVQDFAAAAPAAVSATKADDAATKDTSSENLMEIATPRISSEEEAQKKELLSDDATATAASSSAADTKADNKVNGLGVEGLDGMKEVEI